MQYYLLYDSCRSSTVQEKTVKKQIFKNNGVVDGAYNCVYVSVLFKHDRGLRIACYIYYCLSASVVHNNKCIYYLQTPPSGGNYIRLRVAATLAANELYYRERHGRA